jgi:glycosyltransferase involved in cell wall biosynthesis
VKILHVVALIQASTGGPAVSVTRLASEQAKLGHEVTLACLDYPHLGPQVAAPGVRVVSVRGNLFAVRGRGWCPEFRRVLREEAAKADVVHNHGLWMWPNAYAREAAVAAGKPLIISPRGMLEAWSLGRSKLRKAVAWRLFERKNLQAAVMFHATAESERDSIRNIFSHGLTRIDTDSFSGGDCLGAISDQVVSGSARKSSSSKAAEVPIIVAPNGVDLPDLTRKPGREVLEERFPELKSRRWVMFMSRLHPKKGIDVLLRAWARQNVEQGAGGREQGVRGEKRQKEVMGGEWRVTSPDADESFSLLDSWSLSPVLVIAGSDLIGYRKDVERMVRDLGVEDSVVITGEVQGEMKDCLLANADVFVLPSYSENFGIVVAEAMAWGRPVIASTGMPWKEVADVGAGWWIEPEVDALAKALAEVLGKGREELEAMGARGRALVQERYAWAAPAKQLVEAYERILAIRNI